MAYERVKPTYEYLGLLKGRGFLGYLVHYQFLYKGSALLTLNLLMTTIVAPSTNASKWQMGFNSAFKELSCMSLYIYF